MVKIVQTNDKKPLYQCDECGFHYLERPLAEKCEAWCKEHKSCNIGIVNDAVENNPER